MVFLDHALLLAVWRQHHERGVATIFVGVGLVSEDCPCYSENVGPLGTVFRGEERVDEVVVAPAFGCIVAGEGFLLFAEFGGESVVSFVLPGVLVELLHKFVSTSADISKVYSTSVWIARITC